MRASYDHEPQKIEAVGNGDYLYRYGIKEQRRRTPKHRNEEQEPQQQQWECEEVTIPGAPTSAKITEAVITSRWTTSTEQKLVNDYNAAKLGMYGSTTSDKAKAKIQAYKNYLAERDALKKQIAADCAEAGIK